MKVGIDTSSLIRLLDDESFARRFVARVRGSLFCVPGELVDEMCSGPPEGALKRLSQFRELWDQLPRLEVLSSWIAIWEWECNGRARGQFPYLTRTFRQNLEIANPRNLQAVRTRVKGVKDSYANSHRDAQRVKGELTGPDLDQKVEDWYEKLLNLSHDKVPKWMVDVGLDKFGVKKRVRRRMLAHPRRFRAGWTWMLLYLGGIIGSVLSEWKGYQRYSLLKPFAVGRNNSYDDKLAAACAYCDTFITDDRDLTERLLHIRRRGLSKTEPMALKNFLA